ncbi:hypothetical protein DYB37_002123 [Aphanomyces astaci]|uniref:EF-hand domain-containing protein n=1 Tax=Aphanomyces astaci TaxID=112090 RepID=A0A3R6XAE3_APHAT|nr:hypothetical protein DYB35_001975 [Aphanomyces astaci]RHZ22666.1 hypothetical protein DYB37_002123 [Aphanomyces astaci]
MHEAVSGQLHVLPVATETPSPSTAVHRRSMSHCTDSSPLKPAVSPSKSVSFESNGPQQQHHRRSATPSSDFTKSELEAVERQRNQPPPQPDQTPKKAADPAVIDVDSHPLLANLKVDGKEVGAYMLCKFADDVLGHRARQIFREKASSIKGQNGIYYYLKDLMLKFSHDDDNSTSSSATSTSGGAKKKPPPTKKKDEDDNVGLEEHQFRKLMASDPAFECLVAQEDTTMLFQRIVNSATKSTMSHMDFVEFCLLDRMQLLILLCKYWKSLRKCKLTDNELLDMYRRMTVQGSNESQMAGELFGAALAREFDVEIQVMMDLMDYDGDGIVKPADFETFYKDTDRAQQLTELKEPDAIVDLKYSTNDNDAAELKREGYILYPKNIYEGHGTLYFWYKRARRDSGKPAIEAIQYAPTNMDTALVAQGFVCMNGSKAFAKKFVWIKHTNQQARSNFHAQELGDIFITSGHTADEKSATLWMPPCRGYKQIEGTLDDTNKLTARWTTGRRGVFLWVRYMNEAQDVLEFKPPPSPTANGVVSASVWSKIDELEGQIRQTLRRRCPAEADGVLNFLKLFQSLDKKNRKLLSATKLKLGLVALGLDVMAAKRVDFDAFQRFVLMTDTEVLRSCRDDVSANLVVAGRKVVGNLPDNNTPDAVFNQLNTLGHGKLTLSSLHQEFNAMALDKSIPSMDIKVPT